MTAFNPHSSVLAGYLDVEEAVPVVETLLEQPPLPTIMEAQLEEPRTGTSNFNLYRYRCPLCVKWVLGFDWDNHARDVHHGKKVDFRKI